MRDCGPKHSTVYILAHMQPTVKLCRPVLSVCPITEIGLEIPSASQAISLMPFWPPNVNEVMGRSRSVSRVRGSRSPVPSCDCVLHTWVPLTCLSSFTGLEPRIGPINRWGNWPRTSISVSSGLWDNAASLSVERMTLISIYATLFSHLFK
jgi:hypothetical protein